jgi:carbonic anhydrase
MLTAHEALQRLREGNRRYTTDFLDPQSDISSHRRQALVEGQDPFAVILGCSDSRVPAEIVFDQGLGDLFVIRVAGNLACTSQVGSVEFAAEILGTPLAVVLGHTGCGAIAATLDTLRTHRDPPSEGLRCIVDRVAPAVEALLQEDSASEDPTLADRAVRANVRAATRQLRETSPLLARRIESGELLVVGAEYDLRTGQVDFFDGDED